MTCGRAGSLAEQDAALTTGAERLRGSKRSERRKRKVMLAESDEKGRTSREERLPCDVKQLEGNYNVMPRMSRTPRGPRQHLSHVSQTQL